MNDYTSGMVSEFIEFLHDSIDAYQEATRYLSESDRETQDLLHFIELENADAPTRLKIYKKLKTIRQKRRCAKNTIELLYPIMQWNDKHGDAIIPLKKKTLPTLQAIEIAQERRIYQARTNILNDTPCKTMFEESRG